MRTRSSRCRARATSCGLAWLLVCILPWSSRAHAQTQDDKDDTARAKSHFEQGVVHYSASRFADALADFQTAYRVKPHPLVRVNIANCYDKLDRPAEALEHFEAFLTNATGDSEQRQEVQAAVARLRKRVGRLELRVSPEGAYVTVDAAPVGSAPFRDPFVLKAGSHELSASLDGYETRTLRIDVAAETTTQLELRLVATQNAAPYAGVLHGAAPVNEAPSDEGAAHQSTTVAWSEAAPEGADQEAADPGDRDDAHANRGGVPTSVWVVGGVTLAMAAAGTVTGLLALSAAQRFDENAAARSDSRLTVMQQAAAWDNARDAASLARTLAITTDALLIAALFGAGVTAYLVLSLDRDADDDGDARASTLLVPGLHPAGANLTLSGGF